MRNY
ncbi:hypothetical protein PENPOL_c002G07072 [Penicillium polonicum]|jgi:hypothetical protein